MELVQSAHGLCAIGATKLPLQQPKTDHPLEAREIGMMNGMTRRTALAAMAALMAGPGPSIAKAQATRQAEFRLADLERQHGGRLGVAILDEGSGHRIMHRADERFAM
jgi:beta-lactamase class A